jgi:hypothetical protein
MRNNSRSRKEVRRQGFAKRLINQTMQDMDLLKDPEVNKHLKDLAQIRIDRNKERLVELGLS